MDRSAICIVNNEPYMIYLLRKIDCKAYNNFNISDIIQFQFSNIYTSLKCYMNTSMKLCSIYLEKNAFKIVLYKMTF